MRFWRTLGYVASYVFWYALAFACLYYELAGILIGITALLFLGIITMTWYSTTQGNRLYKNGPDVPAKATNIALPRPWIILSAVIILSYLVRGKMTAIGGPSIDIVFLCIYAAVACITNEILRLTFATWLDQQEERQQLRNELRSRLVEASRTSSPHRARPTGHLKLRFAALLSDEDITEAEVAAEAEVEKHRQAR